jgi:hypothetical protein
VYLHVSSLFESRVFNFMCLHVSKSWLLPHGMVHREGFKHMAGDLEEKIKIA